MTPEQLKELQNLSQLFEQGLAGPEQIKQLSDLLANINNHKDPAEETMHELLSQQQSSF